MSVHGMNHFTILTDDVDGTIAFYREHLGLEPGARPDLGFPGAWLYAGGAAILHVVGGRRREELKPGVIDHMAFSAQGLADTVAQLRAKGIDHTLRRLPGNGQWQLFFHDPDGAKVELDFEAGELAPPATWPVALTGS